MGIEELRKIKENAGLPKEKKKYVIPKISEKRRKKQAEEKKMADPEASLDVWFNSRRPEMVGVCAHCGGKSCKIDDEWFRASIAHLLPKRFFKSVATHPLNWIELCFWNNNCHQKMDDNILDLTEMNCWDTVVERFLAMYPSIAKEERRRIPAALMQYVNIEHD